jgi:hypothetical protein
MHEPFTSQLEGSSTLAGLAPQTAGVVPAPDRYGPGGQRRRGQRGQASASKTSSDQQLLSRRETLALCNQVSKTLYDF